MSSRSGSPSRSADDKACNIHLDEEDVQELARAACQPALPPRSISARERVLPAHPADGLGLSQAFEVGHGPMMTAHYRQFLEHSGGLPAAPRARSAELNRPAGARPMSPNRTRSPSRAYEIDRAEVLREGLEAEAMLAPQRRPVNRNRNIPNSRAEMHRMIGQPGPVAGLAVAGPAGDARARTSAFLADVEQLGLDEPPERAPGTQPPASVRAVKLEQTSREHLRLSQVLRVGHGPMMTAHYRRFLEETGRNPPEQVTRAHSAQPSKSPSRPDQITPRTVMREELEVEALFSQVDTNQDKMIDRKEFQKAVQSGKIRLPPQPALWQDSVAAAELPPHAAAAVRAHTTTVQLAIPATPAVSTAPVQVTSEKEQRKEEKAHDRTLQATRSKPTRRQAYQHGLGQASGQTNGGWETTEPDEFGRCLELCDIAGAGHASQAVKEHYSRPEPDSYVRPPVRPPRKPRNNRRQAYEHGLGREASGPEDKAYSDLIDQHCRACPDTHNFKIRKPTGYKVKNTLGIGAVQAPSVHTPTVEPPLVEEYKHGYRDGFKDASVHATTSAERLELHRHRPVREPEQLRMRVPLYQFEHELLASHRVFRQELRALPVLRHQITPGTEPTSSGRVCITDLLHNPAASSHRREVLAGAVRRLDRESATRRNEVRATGTRM